MTGMDRFDPKERRRERRRNHIARDLKKPEFRQRVVKDKRDRKWTYRDYEKEEDEQ